MCDLRLKSRENACNFRCCSLDADILKKQPKVEDYDDLAETNANTKASEMKTGLILESMSECIFLTM